jgi:hypothetical protein
MNTWRKPALGATAAAFAVAFGAMGSGILNAGAATTTTPKASDSSSTFKSNEDPSHEASESAARERAEHDGTADFGRGGHDGRDCPNEDKGDGDGAQGPQSAPEAAPPASSGSSSSPGV